MSAAIRSSKPQIAAKPELAWNNRILVVEDEREIANIYSEILGGGGEKIVPLRSSRQLKGSGQGVGAKSEFKVTVVGSAAEAMAAVQHEWSKGQRFAMGFFDVLLGPGMDGIELVKQLHLIDPQIYAVFVTAYQDRGVDAIRALLGESQTSHWDYLNKPFSQGEILQKARNFVSLWNLQTEKAIRDDQLANAHRRLLENERTASVAAVARGVSHEFGNILMQIMGKAELGRAKPEKEMRESLDRILDASHRAADILERFKDLSGSSNVNRRRGWVFLPDLIDEALDLLEHPFKVGQIKACKIKMDPVEVVADSTALLQVVVNLSINAIHAMGSSGQIDYSVTKVASGVEIRVRDYGPGVDPKILDKIMEPFFTTKGDHGTGLGLSICREIIEVEHGGQFSLNNHPGKGLEIVMWLPTDSEAEGQDAGN